MELIIQTDSMLCMWLPSVLFARLHATTDNSSRWREEKEEFILVTVRTGKPKLTSDFVKHQNRMFQKWKIAGFGQFQDLKNRQKAKLD